MKRVKLPKANGKGPVLAGMVHVAALPGSPASSMTVDAIAERATAEAVVLAKAGFDCIILENMHDAPYVNGPHPPHTAACMTRIAVEVRRALPGVPLGIQVLSFGHKEALAAALASGASFIRVENFVYAHVADEGLLPNAAAGELLRYRREIGATHIALLCDVQKKHAAHAITADIPIEGAAHAAEFFGADGVIVTGAFTGEPTDPEDIAAVRRGCRLPVWVGSGVEPDQAGMLRDAADGLIVGSWVKKGGVWSNPVDAGRAAAVVRAFKGR